MMRMLIFYYAHKDRVFCRIMFFVPFLVLVPDLVHVSVGRVEPDLQEVRPPLLPEEPGRHRRIRQPRKRKVQRSC